MRPYYDDGVVTIYHGRCEDVLPSLPEADVVFTSPPYNLGTTVAGTGGRFRRTEQAKAGKWGGGGLAHGYHDHDDAMPQDQYETWQRDVLRLCWDRLTDRGAIFYNHKPRIQNGLLWTPLELNPGLPVRQIVMWKRAGGVNFAPTHYVPCHEWVVVFAKPDFRLRSKGASGVGDVWDVPQETGNPHPAPFPVGLPARAIETVAPRLVIDPFMGSGSTLRAAKDAGVPAIGIEKTERYCEQAALRMGQEVLAL